MAILSGVRGAVSIPTAVTRFGTADAVDARVTRWTLEINAEEHDVTTFTGSGTLPSIYRDWQMGMSEWTATIEGFMDSSAALTVPQTVATTGPQDYDTAPTANVKLYTHGGTAAVGWPGSAAARGYSGSGLLTSFRVGAVEKRGGPVPFSATIQGSGGLTEIAVA